jgi:hypothetical protein
MEMEISARWMRSARTHSPSSERKKKGEGGRLQGDQLGICLVYLFGFCRNTRKRGCITVVSCGVKSNQTVLLSLSCGEQASVPCMGEGAPRKV